jgi:hypothetical protein
MRPVYRPGFRYSAEDIRNIRTPNPLDEAAFESRQQCLALFMLTVIQKKISSLHTYRSKIYAIFIKYASVVGSLITEEK